MKSDSKFFKGSKSLPVDKFLNNVLYDKKIGYYNLKNPLGTKGDFITAPKISNLFSEIIGLWLVSTWENFGKPKNLNIVELGPGDGSLIKILLKVFKKFPEFNSSKKIFLFEKSKLLKKFQKKNINGDEVKWINNLNKLSKGPVIFFGNEFFDAIPIKQYKRKKKILFEKYFRLEKNFKIGETFKKISNNDKRKLNSFNSLKNLNFIEFPQKGFYELKKIINKISKLNGCILMIDYGYLKPNNRNTLQSVIKHKKNKILNNLGKADITSHVNFSLLREFFLKNNLSVKKIITQSEFLQNMGIYERANILANNMKFIEQSDLYYRLKRLLGSKSMGQLFKVICAYNHKKSKYFGFK